MKYRVTVTRTGFVYVDAKNKEAAEKYAEETALDSDVWWDNCWDATDCQEVKTMIALMTKIISLSKIMLL